MIHRIIQQNIQVLKNLDNFLDLGVQHAAENNIEVSELLTGQLAPDMFNLTRQVQAATDTAKLCASRLAGKDAPTDADEEKSVEELKARIARVIGYLEEYTVEDFEGALERKIQLPFAPGMYAFGADYLHQFSLPNFYFHVTTAYAILRKAGVPLGKSVFIGALNMHSDQA